MPPKRKPTTKIPPSIAAVAAANQAKKAAAATAQSSVAKPTSSSTSSKPLEPNTRTEIKRQTPLPSKEAGLFKLALKLYEMKQYKKGLKTIEQVLKKVANHGEAIAMRGLFMFQLDNKDEGYKQIKRGTELDPESSIVWHVFGLAYRADKNYTDAVTCYNKALQIDPHNAQILRDLATMLIHIRDYLGCISVRQKLVSFYRGPNQRSQLIGLAVAHHMIGEYAESIAMLDMYADTFKPHPPPRDWDFSEMLLYRNRLLYESGNLDASLSHLDTIEPLVCDVRAVQESRAKILLDMGRAEHALLACTILIKSNPDSRAYIEGFIAASGEKSVDVLEGLIDEYPKSNLIQVMYLTALDAHSDIFINRLTQYLIKNLARGIPSLFSNLLPLYDNEEKTRIITRVMHSILNKPIEELDSSNEGRMWGEYFIAQHYDQLIDYPKAIHHVKLAIAEQPPRETDSGHEDETDQAYGTQIVPELLMLQARIYKHAGHLDTARQYSNLAREADLHDRSVNTKCVKYMLRSNDLAAAEETVVLFARPDMNEPLLDLVDMQCQWFAYESGQVHVRTDQLGLALKRFMQIVNHFKQFEDDHFDFHAYCLRRMTLRSYVDTLSWEARCREHPYFIRGATAAVKQYLRLHLLQDTPKLRDLVAKAYDASKTARKLIAKRKKEVASRKDSDKDVSVIMPDADPLGHTYLTDSDPLLSAHQLIKTLEQVADKHICTHMAAFDLAVRQERWVVAMRAVKKMFHISETDPDMYVRGVFLAHRVMQSDMDTTIRDLVLDGLDSVFPSKTKDKSIDLYACIQSYASAKNSGNSEPVVVAARLKCFVIIGDSDMARSVLDQFLAPSPHEVWRGVTLKMAERAWTLLREDGFGSHVHTLSQQLEKAARDWFAIE